ncbi:6795_t:CDS:2 [Rhizophagus irregularis]|nr:6795_t:CDS:2 [Rhizophagus irregularis]
MDSIDKESKLKEIKQNLVRFASKTFKEMKELGITSLNISDSNAVLENDDVGIFQIIFEENDFNEIDEEEVDSKRQNLRELLLNIDKLPDQQSFMMNPTKFTKIESYVQFLLNKLKSSSTKEEFVEELRCLPPNNENLKDNFEITSEEENSLRENILKQVYESAGYESAEYYYIDEELPRYYPGNNNPDNEESPRYYPDNKESILLMNES